jgi:hypothetical protein
MALSMEDAKRIKELIVQPISDLLSQQIEGVQCGVREMHAYLAQHAAETRRSLAALQKVDDDTLKRVEKLERYRMKLLCAASLVGTVVGLLARLGWEVASSLIHHL